MDSDYLPVLAGRMIGVLIFGSPAIYYLSRSLTAGPRSLRLANFALFCGLAAFLMPEIAFGLSPIEWPMIFLACGTARVLLAIVGIMLAVLAIVIRHDGGAGIARPGIGIGFCLLHLLLGSGTLMFGLSSRPESPWVYQSPEGEYRVTLPSPRWKQAPTNGAVSEIAFVGRTSPRMQAKVVRVNRNQTEVGLGRTTEAFVKKIEPNPQLREKAKFRDGTNEAGNRFRYYTGIDATPDGKPVFIAYSATWCSRKQIIVEVFFEALPKMLSETAKAAEMNIIERSAEKICLSVE